MHFRYASCNRITRNATAKPQRVLVSVIKSNEDLKILKKFRLYRIPVSKIPSLKAEYLAFYQPEGIGGKGKCISCYGKIRTSEILTKKEIIGRIIEIFPVPRNRIACNATAPQSAADNKYHFITLWKLNRQKKIGNTTGIRVSFERTTLKKLKKAKHLFELFGINPIEAMFEKALQKSGIKYKREANVCRNGKLLYRLDFCIEAKDGKFDVECDSSEWHHQKRQREKDAIRDRELSALGYSVIRFPEDRIVRDIKGCISELKKVI